MYFCIIFIMDSLGCYPGFHLRLLWHPRHALPHTGFEELDQLFSDSESKQSSLIFYRKDGRYLHSTVVIYSGIRNFDLQLLILHSPVRCSTWASDVPGALVRLSMTSPRVSEVFLGVSEDWLIWAFSLCSDPNCCRFDNAKNTNFGEIRSYMVNTLNTRLDNGVSFMEWLSAKFFFPKKDDT